MILWLGLSLGANAVFTFIFCCVFIKKNNSNYDKNNERILELLFEKTEHVKRIADSIESIADIYFEINNRKEGL
jgi:hypothetical protein